MALDSQNSQHALPDSAKCKLPLYVKSIPNKFIFLTLLYRANAIAKGTVLFRYEHFVSLTTSSNGNSTNPGHLEASSQVYIGPVLFSRIFVIIPV